jgi:sugar lactone lactonase YvrE
LFGILDGVRAFAAKAVDSRVVLAGVVAALLVSVSLAAATGSEATTSVATPRAALALSPRTALAGAVVSASFKGSSLPSATTLRSVVITWGDGTPPVVLHALAASPKHHYAHAGHYTVRARVTDSKGQSAVSSRSERVVTQDAYWDLFDGQSSSYQLEYTKLPLTTKSTDSVVSGTVENGLRCTAGMGVGPQHRLWILSYPSGCSAPFPAEIQVFRLPFNPSIPPLYTLTLPGSGDDDNLTFDRKGDAWVEDSYNKKIYEFQGPFTDNTTLAPILTLTLPDMTPSGLAVDSKGDLVVANVKSTGTHSIAMYRAPVTEASVPSFLKGLTQPGGLTFDGHGNLYASNNPTVGKGAAIVRYDAGDLKPGAKPGIVDRAGLKGVPYEANFAWDASGNLYVADCGSIANVRVYPLATKPFTSKLSPSVTHRDPSFNDAECAWGLAIG